MTPLHPRAIVPRMGRRGWRQLGRALTLGAVGALLVAGCASDTHIIGRCELASGARAVVADGERSLTPVHQSVGRLGELTLVSWAELQARDDEIFATFYARWLDDSLQRTAEDIRLGRSPRNYHRPQWVPVDGALQAQVWVDPEEQFPPILPEYAVHHCAIEPPPEAAARCDRIQVPTSFGDGVSVFGIGGWGTSAGIEASIPTAVQDGQVWGAMAGIPAECGSYLINLQRLMVFREGDESASPVFWDRPRCDPSDDTQETSNPYLVPLGERGMGVLLRVGFLGEPPADGQVKLLTLDENAEPIGPPVDVGSDHDRTTVDGGNQPRGVAVGGRLLFTERRGPENDCHALRVAKLDGSGAHDAPWQLPCIRRPGRWKTASHALLEVPGAAVLVWGERTRIDTLGVTADTDYEERIRAVLLTPEGKRGSEIVTVTDPAATVLSSYPRTEDDGPLPRDFPVAAGAGDGGEITVAWRDERAGAPGIYARRLRCRVD